MVKLYCDRCKKILNENTQLDISGYVNAKLDRYGEKEFYLVDKYVLCNDCLHDFNIFMKDKKIGENA